MESVFRIKIGMVCGCIGPEFFGRDVCIMDGLPFLYGATPNLKTKKPIMASITGSNLMTRLFMRDIRLVFLTDKRAAAAVLFSPFEKLARQPPPGKSP